MMNRGEIACLLCMLLLQGVWGNLKTSSAAESSVGSTKQGTLIVRNALCSSLVFSIINFWNISLLFTFLDFDSQPQFSKDIMRSLASIFYDSEDFISSLGTRLSKKEVSFDLKGVA